MAVTRSMHRIGGAPLIATAVALLAACANLEADRADRETATTPTILVERVIDGDTFVVRSDGASAEVRLIGINSAERGECFADDATRALESRLGSGSIRLESDTTDTDRYGRLLRYVWADDVFVNEALVADGFAIAQRFEPDTAQADRLDAAQATAKAEGRGLWADEACGDATDTDLEFSEIVADPPGDDTLDLNGEWVAVSNRGAEPVDLSAWTIKDESSSHRYVFDAGTTLPAGATLVLRTGCGIDTDTEFFWCQSNSAVWNNGGDTAFLLDPAGNVVVSRSTDSGGD